MIKQIIDKQCLVDCKEITENTATFDLNTNALKLGKAKLSPQKMKEIAFLFAHDLINFAETNGDFSDLSAKAVYMHLQNNQ